MELYLLRHGIAYDSEMWTGNGDESRPLTNAGVAAMQREAASIKSAHIKIDAILTSPLVRTRQTAEIIAEALGLQVLDSSLLKPGFNAKALAEVLEEQAEVQHLMLVGHAPDLGRVIGDVIGGGQVEMFKGSLAHLHISHRTPPRGTLYSLLPPEILGA